MTALDGCPFIPDQSGKLFFALKHKKHVRFAGGKADQE
jgi:hypothetical protein